MNQPNKTEQVKANLKFIRNEIDRRQTAYLERRSNFFRDMSVLAPDDDLLDVLRTQDVQMLVEAELVYRWVTRLDEVLATNDLAAIILTLEALQQQATGQLIYTAKAMQDVWDSTEAEAYAELIGQLQFWQSLLKSLI